MKPIVICADDFGLSPGINAGILDLARRGRLSAASCMTTGKSFARDARQLVDLPVQTGLHLNLTEPLEDDAFYQPLPHLLKSTYLRRIDRRRLLHEIDRQFDAFDATFRRAPDYVDGHQHVHQFPVVRDCLLHTLRRRYPDFRPWLRSTSPGVSCRTPWRHRLKAGFIGLLGAARLARQAGRSGFPMSRRLLGVYDFQGGESAYLSLLDVWLLHAKAGDLVMCHPAQWIESDDGIGRQRVEEYRALSGDAFAALLHSHGFTVRTHNREE